MRCRCRLKRSPGESKKTRGVTTSEDRQQAKRARGCRAPALLLQRLPSSESDHRRNDVSGHDELALETAEDVIRTLIHRHEPGYWRAFSGDFEWFAVLPNLLHQTQAMGLELAGRVSFHGPFSSMTMIVRPWSLGDNHVGPTQS